MTTMWWAVPSHELGRYDALDFEANYSVVLDRLVGHRDGSRASSPPPEVGAGIAI